jgi:hypothetical protein
MIHLPNLILIAGTGRKVGKTTLACEIIHSLAETGQQVVAIKLTPHFHQVCNSCETLVKTPDLLISREWSCNPVKDSARMYAAGANPVYFIQVNDPALGEVIDFIIHEIPASANIVCESAGLRRYLKPGLFIMIKGDEEHPKNLDLIELADLILKPFEKIQPEFCNGL